MRTHTHPPTHPPSLLQSPLTPHSLSLPPSLPASLAPPLPVEDLIQREYLERDKDNPQLFKYLA